MNTIYCIEDINDLKYVGRTKQKLYDRFSSHKYDKKIGGNCSSNKLNLEYCIIYPLETNVSEKDKKVRERYWINEIDCVNKMKLDFNRKENYKKYYERNKEKISKQKKEYYQKKKTDAVKI
jgi:hypothetical protein